MFLLGMPFYVIFVQLPQRFQAVNFTTAERAGILLLPATLMTPVGAMISGLAAKNVPIEMILISSACVVCIGVGLLSSLPTQIALSGKTYAYEVVAGIGLGLASPPYFMLIATSVAEKDMSVATGTLSELFLANTMWYMRRPNLRLDMVRTLGGCVAVAICSAIHREHLHNRLSSFLSTTQIAAVLKSSGYVAQLPEQTRYRVGNSFGGSYNKQLQIMLAFAGLNVIVTILLAFVRKKMGIFGTMPQRKEANEFTQAAEQKTDVGEAVNIPTDTTTTAVDRSPKPNQESEKILAAHQT
jgi:hypothetical protein